MIFTEVCKKIPYQISDELFHENKEYHAKRCELKTKLNKLEAANDSLYSIISYYS